MQTHKWDDFRVILALHRHGSLKAAAANLGVNISTVSRRLDVVEEALGIHLFDRTPEGTLPTEAANQLVPYAETMERAAFEFTHTLDGFEAEPEGVVRITAPPGLVDHFLAPNLTPLLRRYPKLRIEILSSIGYADLTRREADIALRAMRPVTGDLVATKLISSPWTVLASPRYRKELGRMKSPNDARWTTWGPELAHLGDARWILQNVDERNLVLRTNNMTAQVEAVRSGLAVMMAPTSFADLRGLEPVDLSRPLKRSIAEIGESSLWLVGHRALRDVPRISRGVGLPLRALPVVRYTPRVRATLALALVAGCTPTDNIFFRSELPSDVKWVAVALVDGDEVVVGGPGSSPPDEMPVRLLGSTAGYDEMILLGFDEALEREVGVSGSRAAADGLPHSRGLREKTPTRGVRRTARSEWGAGGDDLPAARDRGLGRGLSEPRGAGAHRCGRHLSRLRL